MIVGADPWVVSQVVDILWQGIRPSERGVFVFTIVEDGGTQRISGAVEYTADRHRWVMEGRRAGNGRPTIGCPH